MLNILLGSKTKVKILEILSSFPDGLSRNKIAEFSALHPNNIYDQIDDLVFFDIISKQGKLYLLNPDHPLYETIKSFFLLFNDFSNHFSDSLIPFIHSKLSPHYYFTGFFAASRMITPIDYTESVLNIAIAKPFYQSVIQKLSLLSTFEDISFQSFQPGKISLFIHEVASIPADVHLDSFNNQDMYLASVTTGTIDSFILPGISDYGKCLVLLQNDSDGLIDYSILKDRLIKNSIPLNMLVVLHEFFCRGIGNFNQIQDIKFLPDESKDLINESLQKAINESINTVLG